MFYVLLASALNDDTVTAQNEIGETAVDVSCTLFGAAISTERNGVLSTEDSWQHPRAIFMSYLYIYQCSRKN